jgi:alpha-glucosidase
VERLEALLPPGGWPTWVMGNHDRPRLATRAGSAQARVAAMLLLTLRGTPTLYYGDEIGMENVSVPQDQVRDPWEKNTPGLGLGRDPVRTPMQWSAGRNAGFTGGRPWLPLAAGYRECNVEALKGRGDSLLNLYRELIHLRKNEPALRQGAYRTLSVTGSVFAFCRRHDVGEIRVVLNFGSDPVGFTLEGGTILLSTCPDRGGESVRGPVRLRGNEGMVIRLE